MKNFYTVFMSVLPIGHGNSWNLEVYFLRMMEIKVDLIVERSLYGFAYKKNNHTETKNR